MHRSGMTLEGSAYLAGSYIPQLDLIGGKEVVATIIVRAAYRGQGLAIRAERDEPPW
jgi:hypothetical protein